MYEDVCDNQDFIEKIVNIMITYYKDEYLKQNLSFYKSYSPKIEKLLLELK